MVFAGELQFRQKAWMFSSFFSAIASIVAHLQESLLYLIFICWGNEIYFIMNKNFY